MMYDRFDEKMIVETFRLLSLSRALTISRRWIYVLGVSFRSRSLVSFLAPNSFWTLIRIATFAVGALPSTIDGFVAAENFFLLSFFLSFFLCATRDTWCDRARDSPAGSRYKLAIDRKAEGKSGWFWREYEFANM